MECESILFVTNLSNSFSNSFIDFLQLRSCFMKWYVSTWCSCEVFTFCDVLLETKQRKANNSQECTVPTGIIFKREDSCQNRGNIIIGTCNLKMSVEFSLYTHEPLGLGVKIQVTCGIFHCIPLLYHAIENTLVSTINMIYAGCMMGRLDAFSLCG